MTIASEIEDLQTNLAAAKSAVVAKGGTSGDTGLAGLATEITSIPSASLTNYGTLTYLDNNDVEQTLTLPEVGYQELTLTGQGQEIIINNITMTIHVQVFLWIHVFTYVGWNHWVIW